MALMERITMVSKETQIHIRAAIRQGDIDTVSALLGSDTERLNLMTPFGTWLHVAASDGHADVVNYLMSSGAILDVSDPERNPLFGAIYGGHVDIVKILLQAGIDTKVKYTGDSMKDMDAFAFARERGQLEIASMLASD